MNLRDTWWMIKIRGELARMQTPAQRLWLLQSYFDEGSISQSLFLALLDEATGDKPVNAPGGSA